MLQKKDVCLGCEVGLVDEAECGDLVCERLAEARVDPAPERQAGR